MNRTCELLLKSFYEDEWKEEFYCMKRKKDGIELWWMGVFSFSGYDNNIYIPFFMRPYMYYHFLRGQNDVATKRLLEPEATHA